MSGVASSGWRIDAAHRLGPPARALDSPHQDARPEPQDVSLIVIHNISLPPGEFGGAAVDDLFMGTLDCDAHPFFEGLRGLRVSAHLCIDRRGRLTQYVPFDRRAWHAGVSSWRGRRHCNDFSIGIELEGTDVLAFTPAQYEVLAGVLRVLFAHYPHLDAGALTGHSDIAPGRKTDPGPAFDWSHLHRLLDDA